MDQRRTALATKKVAPTGQSPLVSVFEEGTLTIRFEAGGRAKLLGGRHRSSQSIFCLALWGSLHLGGQPVRCTGIVPGVSVRVAAGNMKLNDKEAIRLSDESWHAVYGRLGKWLADGPREQSRYGVWLASGLQIEFAWDDVATVHPGVMEIDVEYTNAHAAASLRRHRRPR